MANCKLTITRVVLFCLCCAFTLAMISGLVKNFQTVWNQHIMLVIVIPIIYGLTILFTKWENLSLKNVGVVPGNTTVKKFFIGLTIGFLMTLLQPAFVLIFGHYEILFNTSVSAYSIIFYAALYFLVAIREELAFRGYPLFSLNIRFGNWTAQIIILILFALEHIAGGMTWFQAFLGAGTGALLFGLTAVKTKGIALPIGLHTAWNFGQWCVGFKKETGILQGIADEGFKNVVERNAWISYLLIMAIAIIGFYLYKPRKT